MSTERAAGWALIGGAIVARRAELGWSQADLARAAAVSTATIRKIERGHEQDYRQDIRARIETAMGWPHGKINGLLGHVVLSSPAAAEAGELSLAAEVARLRRDLLALTVEVVALRTQIGPTPAQPADRQAGQA